MTDGTSSMTVSPNVFNVVGHTTNGANSYPEQWTERGTSNKVVFLNTPPPVPQHTRSG